MQVTQSSCNITGARLTDIQFLEGVPCGICVTDSLIANRYV